MADDGTSRSNHADDAQPVTADRRQGPDRRKSVVDQRTDGNGFERRRGPGRRRSDFIKAADEGELTDEQFLFLKAIDAFKSANHKPYPSWTDVLEVIRKLGYRKTMPMTVDVPAAEDWTEPADAPAFPQSRSNQTSDDERDDHDDTTEVCFDDFIDPVD
jgi:hypothetical protein